MAVERSRAVGWLRRGCLGLAVAAILAGGWLAVAGLRGMRSWLRDATCYKNSLSISNSLAAYMQDYDGYLPPTTMPWTQALMPYLGSEAVLVCPAAGDAVRPGYLLRTLPAGTGAGSLAEPSSQILGIDPGGIAA